MIWEDQFLENRLTFQPLGEKISLKEPNKTSHKKRKEILSSACNIPAFTTSGAHGSGRTLAIVRRNATTSVQTRLFTNGCQ